MYPRTASKLLMVATFLVAFTICVDHANADGWFACLRKTVYDRVLTNIESRSAVVKDYKLAVQRAAERYEQHVTDPNTQKPKDAAEEENLFLKFVAEEVRDLELRVEKEGIKGNDDVKQFESELQACGLDRNFDESKWGNWNPEKDLDDETFDAVAKEHKSFEDLKQLEAEMGMALDDKTRENLKIRTKMVLSDLLQNEATQIASAILSAYFTGGSSLVAVIVPFLPSIKIKVVEFLLNSVVEVVKMKLGQEIEIKPLDATKQAQRVDAQPELAHAESFEAQAVPVMA